MRHPCYESNIYNPYKLNKIAIYVGKWCKENNIDSVAGMGFSSLIPAAVLSAKYKINLITVRKERDDCHSSEIVQARENFRVNNYIIIDDLISSGDTVKRIIDQIIANKNYNDNPVCKAIFLYTDSSDWSYNALINEHKGIPVIYIKPEYLK